MILYRFGILEVPKLQINTHNGGIQKLSNDLMIIDVPFL